MPLTIPTFSQDRGQRLFDPVTNSSVSKPNSYCVSQCFTNFDGTCEGINYRKSGIDIVINDQSNCVTRLKAAASLRLFVNAEQMTEADIDTLVNEIRDRIRTAAAADCGETAAPDPGTGTTV